MTAISSISNSNTSAATLDPSKGAARFASRVFKDMDADTDGKVSKDEFVKGLESNGVSADDATRQYEAIDKEGTGSITKDDLESAIKSGDFKPPRPQGGAEGAQGGGAARAAGGGGGPGAGRAGRWSPTNDAADTKQEQLVYDMAQAAKSAAASTSADKLGTNIDALA